MPSAHGAEHTRRWYLQGGQHVAVLWLRSASGMGGAPAVQMHDASLLASTFLQLLVSPEAAL